MILISLLLITESFEERTYQYYQYESYDDYINDKALEFYIWPNYVPAIIHFSLLLCAFILLYFRN